MTRSLVVMLALVACGKDNRRHELDAARRAEVRELATADVNKDGTLDVLVGYGPSMKDDPGTRFSTIEAFDGRTHTALWVNRLPRWFSPSTLESTPRVAMNERYVAFTYVEEPAKPGGDFVGALSVHELATGRPRWHRTFSDTPHWVGVAFRVWADGDQLLVLTDPQSSSGQVLHAFDFATGTERWQQRLGAARSTPVIVDNNYVLLGQDDIVHVALFVDRHTGTLSSVALPSDHIVVGDDALWAVCPSYVPQCESAGTDPRGLTRDALARVDLHTRALSVVRPLNAAMVERLATYKDLSLEVNALQIVATRIGDTKPVWTLDPFAIDLQQLDNLHDVPLQARHLRNIPARYVPVIALGDGPRIAVIDLETGTVTWKSQPFQRTLRTGFVVHGKHYFINIPDVDTMLAFNGATGTFDGAFQIAAGGVRQFPNADAYEGQLYATDFQSGQLLGHERGPSWWMIDLASGALVASPGVQLLSPWSDVERVLGPLPR
jgi:hypothetical protein